MKDDRASYSSLLGEVFFKNRCEHGGYFFLCQGWVLVKRDFMLCLLPRHCLVCFCCSAAGACFECWQLFWLTLVPGWTSAEF